MANIGDQTYNARKTALELAHSKASLAMSKTTSPDGDFYTKRILEDAEKFAKFLLEGEVK